MASHVGRHDIHNSAAAAAAAVAVVAAAAAAAAAAAGVASDVTGSGQFMRLQKLPR